MPSVRRATSGVAGGTFATGEQMVAGGTTTARRSSSSSRSRRRQAARGGQTVGTGSTAGYMQIARDLNGLGVLRPGANLNAIAHAISVTFRANRV